MLKALIFLIYLIGCYAHAQNLMPIRDGRPFMPDEWLQSTGQPHHLRIPATGRGRVLGMRQPTPEENHVITEIEKYFQSSNIVVLAFVDGDNIVRILSKPTHKSGPLLSASVGKTVTAVSAGLAICDGQLTLTTKIRDLLKDFENKDVGNATLAQLLTMSSGSRAPLSDSTIMTEEERKKLNEGSLTIKELLLGRWGDANSSLFAKEEPGERFEYKSTDPLLVGMMVAAAYGSKDGSGFAGWQARNLLPKIETNDMVIIGQDRVGFALSGGNIRMSILDWIRFGVFVNEKRQDQDCLGEFIRDMSTPQRKIQSTHGADMRGYGYFTWNDNKTVPASYWAQGYGGQFIGWSTQNKKMIVMFSTQERAVVAHQIAKHWFAAR